MIQTQPAKVPDAIKKFVGDSVMVKQTETWSGSDGTGNRSADIRFTVIGQPVDMLGRADALRRG